MKQLGSAILGSLLVGAAAALFALGWDGPTTAFACTGPPTTWQMASSPLVIAGRIMAAEEDPSLSDAIYRGFHIQIEVEQGFRGAAPGDRIQAFARVPGPVPVMCPQFDRDETFLGKFVVAGLLTGADTPEFYRWGTAYIGLDPGNSDYADAVRAARIATGGGPDLPSLTVTVAGQKCGSFVTDAGSRFEPGGKILLNYPLEPGESGEFVHPTVAADTAGRFVHSFRLPRDWCPLDSFVEAFEWREDSQIGGWPLAMERITASGDAPLPPDVGNSRGTTERGARWLQPAAAGLLLLALARRMARKRG